MDGFGFNYLQEPEPVDMLAERERAEDYYDAHEDYYR